VASILEFDLRSDRSWSLDGFIGRRWLAVKLLPSQTPHLP
jgi:hypothetical protein